jgi:hypothetical protein
MQAGQVFPITTIDGVHFTDGLLSNVAELETLDLPGVIGAGGIGRCRIRGAILWANDNCDFEFQVYGKAIGPNDDPNLCSYCGRWTWVAADGVQNAGAGLYRYYIDGLDIAYEDQDSEGSGVPPLPVGLAKIHLLLVNRSAMTKKEAYADGGRLRLVLNVEPVYGG